MDSLRTPPTIVGNLHPVVREIVCTLWVCFIIFLIIGILRILSIRSGDLDDGYYHNTLPRPNIDKHQ